MVDFGFGRRGHGSHVLASWAMDFETVPKGVCGALVFTLALATPTLGSAELPATRIFPSMRSGVTTQEFSPTGWWLDAGLLAEQPLLTPWFYVTFEAALAATRDTESRTLQFYSDGDTQTANTRRFTLGIPLRLGFGIGSEVFGVEFGGVAGATWASLQCNVCPNDSKLRPVFGGYAGPVLRIGQERRIRVAAQFQMISPILPKCSNIGHSISAAGEDTRFPVWFYDSPPNPSIVGQLGIQW